MSARRRCRPLSVALLLALAPALAFAAPPAAPDHRVETLVQAEIAVRGMVTAVDLGQRIVTLETGTGTRALAVDPAVAQLEDLAIGDVIDVRYHRSILFDIQPAGSAEPGAWISERARDLGGVDGPGTQVGEQEVTVVATVIEVDGDAGTFTVQGPSGNVRTLHAETADHREAVKRIRTGDLLRVRFREGMAVSLAPVELH